METNPETPQEKAKTGVLSLTHLARLKCINNAHIINDIGITPYHLIEPVLMKKTAKSLRNIESMSPQIISDAEPLWKALVKRDFPDRPDSQIIPQNGKKVSISSRNLYDKYVKEREQQRQNAASNLRQITRNLDEIKNKNKVKAINKVLPSNKPRLPYSRGNTNNTGNNFKSSLLQKARVLNKQRVRNFSQSQSKPIMHSNTIGLVKIGSASNTSSRSILSSPISSPQKPNRPIPIPSSTPSITKIPTSNKKRADSSSTNILGVKRQRINNTDPKERTKKSKSYVYLNN